MCVAPADHTYASYFLDLCAPPRLARPRRGCEARGRERRRLRRLLRLPRQDRQGRPGVRHRRLREVGSRGSGVLHRLPRGLHDGAARRRAREAFARGPGRRRPDREGALARARRPRREGRRGRARGRGEGLRAPRLPRLRELPRGEQPGDVGRVAGVDPLEVAARGREGRWPDLRLVPRRDPRGPEARALRSEGHRPPGSGRTPARGATRARPRGSPRSSRTSPSRRPAATSCRTSSTSPSPGSRR